MALAHLEQEFDGRFLLVTQNIDDLHERAGSQNVLHMHGELRRMRCSRSYAIFPIDGDITAEMACSCCNLQGTLRPHVVGFGEIPLYMDDTSPALWHCDLFVAIGTSGLVYPAANFVRMASVAHRVDINLRGTAADRLFHECIRMPATKGVPEMVNRLIARGKI